MNYGLYLSASGVLTNTYRQDVFANNLANVETVGFKPDMPSIRQRDPESVEDQLGMDVSNEIMDRLGGGVLAGTQRINFTPGSLQSTGNGLDVALTEKNQFFAVRSVNPETGQPQVTLTRDGRFTLNHQNELVTQSGLKVLSDADEPIVVPHGAEASIGPNAQVIVDGKDVAQLQVSRVNNLGRLNKIGDGQFAYTGQDPRSPVENIRVRPGFVETSGVDPISTMMKIVSATKAVTGNANMIRYHDALLDRAVNTLGRVG